MSSQGAKTAKKSPERVDVTKTFLPPLEEYITYVERIWNNGWITNQGQLLQEFEEKAAAYLELKELQMVSNGTVALQLALHTLGATEGEIITTPFSYVATTSAILWERFTPVYVDIEPDTFCIDADKIEAAITDQTKAILAVHVFGFPCNVEKIQVIAKKHNLKVIYDGAHAFGVKYKNKPLLSYGDISVCSFHATKLFHSIEGGCIVTNDAKLKEHIGLMKHFGHKGDDHYLLGINAKASEFQAAMGLCNLPHIDEIIASRKAVTELYDRLIHARFKRPVLPAQTQRNYAYYPLVFKTEAQLLGVLERLRAKNIFPRRYFYPSLNTLSYVHGAACPISEDIASRIACLPLFMGLPEKVIATIARVINEA